MSLDTAHSLADAFDLDRRLMDKNKGQPVEVADNLSIQEIDVVEEIDKNWGEVYRYFATLLNVTGLDEVLAEELAVLPGMEEVSALLGDPAQRARMSGMANPYGDGRAGSRIAGICLNFLCGQGS